MNIQAPVYKILPSTYSTLIVGFANKIAVVRSNRIFALQTAAGVDICSIRLDSSYRLQVLNRLGVLVATGTTSLSPGSWHYIELKLVVGSSGTCEIHIDGVSGEIASTTGDFGTTNIGRVLFDASALENSEVFDDVYALDTSGSAPRNTFLGDVIVETLYPVADGNYSEWTPDTGTNHHARVNELQADDDASVITTETVNARDTFVMENLGIILGTVYGCQLNVDARKNDSAARQIKPMIRLSATDYLGPLGTLTMTYLFYSWLLEQDPSGTDWTITTVNATEGGVKLIT